MKQFRLFLNSIKKFFAPCMELLAFPELKSIFLFSVASAQQAFRLFVTYFWWLFPLLFVVSFAINQTMIATIIPVLGKFGFFDVAGGMHVPQISVMSLVSSLLIIALCAYFFSFVGMLLMRPSREAKDWNYLMENLNTYFQPTMILFPLYFLLSLSPAFSASSLNIWVFAMLFFVDSQPTTECLIKAFQRGFWAYMRFFPVIILVSVAAFVCFMVVALALALLAGLVLWALPATLLVAQVIVWLGVLVFTFFAAPMVFFHLAVINTVYVKIMSKYRTLFFEEA